MNANTNAAPLTFKDMNELIPKMQKGQSLIYHIGSLAYDRAIGVLAYSVHGVAMAAYQAYQRGEVTLVQHKVGPMQFEYIAIRR